MSAEPVDREDATREAGRRLAASLHPALAGCDPSPTLQALPQIADWLDEVEPQFATLSDRRADWVLDNAYILRRTLRSLGSDLRRANLAALPAVRRDGAKVAQASLVARALIEETGGQLRLEDVTAFLEGYQREHPLRLAELWALPSLMALAALDMFLAVSAGIPGITSPPVKPPTHREAEDGHDPFADAFRTWQTLGKLNWASVVLTVGLVHRILGDDPADYYRDMDEETQASYATAVEQLAAGSGRSEFDVAHRAVALARERGDRPRTRHVGHWLVGNGLTAMETALGIERTFIERVRHALLHHRGSLYALAISMGVLLALVVPSLYLARHGSSALEWTTALALLFLPASVFSVTIVHWLALRLIRPTRLPALQPDKAMTDENRTAVAVPVIVGSPAEVPAILRAMELRQAGNQGEYIVHVLLSDPPDATSERAPEDFTIEEALKDGIAALNARIPGAPFVLLHRRRLWSESEECWMSWERKRGKLSDFNALLIHGDRSDFPVRAGPVSRLRDIRYVVTVDADTVLPPESVARLVATMAHPLNWPTIARRGRRVVRGHAIMQPRVDTLIDPRADQGSGSWFSRLFAGDGAIDIYSRAVSNVYQDLFGIGIYCGKGIYDVHAFSAALDGRVPEGSILSHDLFEGLFARAALASHIVVYEDYPQTYPQHAARQHRWTRGDWQLLPWLAGRVPDAEGKRVRNPLTLLDRWLMLDNLRRSLVPPALLLLFVAGWMLLPGSAWMWTLLAFLAPAIYAIDGVYGALSGGPRRGFVSSTLHTLAIDGGRWFLSIAFLVNDTLVAADAIGRALWRTYGSRRHLLEWRSAAHTRTGRDRRSTWTQMWPATAFALALAINLALYDLAALASAAPILALWALSPEIAYRLARARSFRRDRLLAADRRYLRMVARRTWHYFETFVGPASNWLPPDNYQRDHIDAVAHRTSPTNIGMYLTSALAAHDLGFIGTADLAIRVRNALNAMDRMETFQGHWLNWYETTSLKPLEPRYVSSVDSGNLAVALVALGEGLREIAGQEPRAAEAATSRWKGLIAVLDCLQAEVSHDETGTGLVAQMLAEALFALEDAAHGHALDRLTQLHAPALRAHILAAPPEAFGTDALVWLERLEHDLRRMRDDGAMDEEEGPNLPGLAQRAWDCAKGMNFRPLYDEQRHLLRIGYNLSSGHHDANHYDLLASEARLASFFAIAKGDLPMRHWAAMARPVALLGGRPALISWNGSAFEYLMPPLFLPARRDTLLGESEATAIEHQRRAGAEGGRPWGVSESAFAATDAHGNYQYRAFGDPDLGLRRDLDRDDVIAPYATALSLSAWPHAAVENMRRLEDLGALQSHGFVEALDYTPARVPAGRDFATVGTFMAHHQGMTLAAIANALFDDVLVERTMRDVQLATPAHLLHEHVPWGAEFEDTTGPAILPVPTRTVHGLPGWEPRRPYAVHALGNDRMGSLVTPDGRGRLTWNDIDLTRWRPPLGSDALPFVRLRDPDDDHEWTFGDRHVENRVALRADRVELTGRENGLAVHLDVMVSPHTDAEIKRFTLVNETDREREVELTLTAEIALAPAADDERHPAFSKMFVRSRYLPADAALLFTRRPRKPGEKTAAFVQRIAGIGEDVRLVGFETDRERFLGRHGQGGQVSGTQGFTLDPVSVLRLAVRIAPFATQEVALVSGAGATAEEALAHARAFSSPPFDWAFREAEHDALRTVAAEGLMPDSLPDCQLLVTALERPGGARPRPGRTLSQPDLWRFGISGDLPIVLMVVEPENETPPLASLLAMQTHLRKSRVRFDLVVLDRGGESYDQRVHTRILDTLRSLDVLDRVGMPGGVHVIPVNRLSAEEADALNATARLVIDAAHPVIARALDTLERKEERPAPFDPQATLSRHCEPAALRELTFAHEWGGLDAASADYLVTGDTPPPAPWCNVLANDDFGAIASESGLGFSWAGNSGEFKLTPWSNDPVLDPQGETVWLRDERTGSVWTVSPLPAGAPCETRHGLGFTRWTRRSHGLLQEQTAFVPPDTACRIVTLKLRNETDAERRVTLTFAVAWVLGATASAARHATRARFDDGLKAITACNVWNPEFADRVAYLASDHALHDFSCDRASMEAGSDGVPDALQRWGFGRIAADTGDPGGAAQVHVELKPGGEREISFFLGCETSEAAVADTLAALRQDGAVKAAFERTANWWNERVGSVRVQTPDPAFDAMVNRWLPVQNLSSRLLARAGFYQAGGAYGFRDQLQDVLALLMSDPERARTQILRAAGRQFEAGDVLHWWHPPGGRGVRTRITDDYLWLPYVVARYVEATGDAAVLDEKIPFLSGEPLKDGEHDRYALFEEGRTVSLHEHCAVALERMQHTGAHGLPFIGTGDWNDGMDRIGDEGRGESVWLAWFQIAVAEAFAPLGEHRGDDRHRSWTAHANRLRASVEEAWDGEWYRRAYDDEGSPVGSKGDAACEIDAISQSWSVLAGGDRPDRQRRAMRSVDARLVDPQARLVKLLDPAFADAERDPGYIASYPPGIRENGGQYTHAAAWHGLALARMGDVDAAARVFDLLNPLNRGDIANYRREPYVLSADIGGVEPHVGRGGWSWYTGASGWTWQLAVHGILGVRQVDGEIELRPALPQGWETATVTIARPDGSLELEIVREGSSPDVPTYRFAIPTDGSFRRERCGFGAQPSLQKVS